MIIKLLLYYSIPSTKKSPAPWLASINALSYFLSQTPCCYVKSITTSPLNGQTARLSTHLEAQIKKLNRKDRHGSQTVKAITYISSQVSALVKSSSRYRWDSRSGLNCAFEIFNWAGEGCRIGRYQYFNDLQCLYMITTLMLMSSLWLISTPLAGTLCLSQCRRLFVHHLPFLIPSAFIAHTIPWSNVIFAQGCKR